MAIEKYTIEVTRHELACIMSALCVIEINAHKAYVLGDNDAKKSFDELCQVINKLYEQRDKQEENL